MGVDEGGLLEDPTQCLGTGGVEDKGLVGNVSLMVELGNLRVFGIAET